MGKKKNNKLKSNGPVEVNPSSSGPGNGAAAAPGIEKPQAKTTIDSGDDIPGIGEIGEDADKSAQKAADEIKAKSGILGHLADDLDYAKKFGSDVADAMSGKTTKAAEEIGKKINKVEALSDAGSNFLTGMGRGNKTLGATKIGAYMIGGSMLVDMLNPFDDD